MPGNIYDQAVADLPPLPTVAPVPPPSVGGIGPGTRYGSGSAPPNPYDDAVAQLSANETTQLQSSFAATADITPEQAAEARRLAGKTGVPMPEVLRNLKTYQQEDARDQPFQAIQQQTPHLADWLAADPQHAAVAKDDLAQLGALEWLVTMPARAVAQTINQQRYGALRSASIYRDLTRSELDQLDSYKFQMQADGSLGVGDSWFKGALVKGLQLGATLTIPEAIPSLFGGVAGAVAGGILGTLIEPVGGTVAGAVAGARLGARAGYTEGLAKSAFQTESGAAYDEYLNFKDEYGQPLDPNVAKMAALATGAINSLLMVGGGAVIAKSLGTGVEKLTTGFTRDAVQQALKNPTVRAALADAMKGYAGTLAEGTGLMVGMAGVRILSGELAKATGKSTLAPGQLQSGNVDLFQQPTVKNADGSVSTVDSLSVNIDGKEVLLPTVTPDGRHFTGTPDERTQQAVAEYQKTGRQLGTFATPQDATAFAEQLHADYAAGRYAGVNKYRSPEDIARELTTAAEEAIQGFALVGAVGPALGLIGDVRRAADAKQNVALFTALSEGVTNSKTMARAPDAVRDFLAKATQDGPVETVYAPVDTFVQYWQSQHVDPAKMAAELTGKPDALELAQRAGEDLAIPTADYATKLAGTEHHAFFAQEIRLGARAMNGREATAFEQHELPKFLAALQTTDTASTAASAQIRATVVDRLMQGGQMERSTAETNAAVVESFFKEFVGERAGLDPAALFAKRVGDIQRTAAPPDALAVEPTFTQERRAAVSFDPAGRATISLFEQADLSSFQHEWAHVSLELIGDVVDQIKARDPATLTGGQARILDDYKTVLLPFLGVDSREQIGRTQHEQFANAWEDYVKEGKAPSAELRPVFARMRAWLVSVYRQVQRTVTLTPEVRSFMDRLVASDTAIEQAQADGHLTPLFTDAASAGMSETAFAGYRDTVQAASDRAKDDLQQELMREQQRAQQAWWTDERAKTRAVVATEAHQEPVYRALSAIQKGTRPDGTPFVEGDTPVPMRLAKADLVGHYTADEMTLLRRRQLYAADEKGGVSPQAMAELTGFSSGDELVRALLAAPSMNKAIDAETDARMTAAHGDLRLDGRLADHAEAAVFGEHRQKVVEAELKALTTGMVKGTIPPTSVLRAYAEQRIGGMKVRDVTPGQFLMAAQRASAKAFDLLSTNQDRVGAVQAKQQELINLALYREARDAQAAAAKTFDYARSFDTSRKRERIGKVGGDFLDQIDGLRERVGLTRLTLKEIDRRTALAQWAKDKAASTGLPVDFPLDLLNEARRTHYKDLTIDQVRGLHDGLRMIEHLALLKDKLLRTQGERDLAVLATDGAASIDANTRKPRVVALGPRRPGEAGKRTLQGWLIAHRPLLAILRQMDGFKDGFLFEHIWRPAHEARNAEVAMSHAAAVRWAEIHQARFEGEEASLHQETYIPALGNSMTTAERLVVALNSGNDGNRERMTAAGVGNSGPLGEPVQQAILNTLTPRDWTYVRDMAELMSSHRPEIGALAKRVTGVEPTWVEPTPFHTPHGEQPGWYYPIVYEGRSSARALPGPEASFADIVGKSAYLHFMTNDGHTEQRVAHTGIPLRADLGVIGEHLQQVVHDLTHREMLIDVGRILGRKEIQEAIYRNYGDQHYQEIQGAFRDVAIGPMPAPPWYRTVMSLRRGATMARLAWNFATMVRHVTNITNGMVRVGAGDVAAAIPKWLGSAKDAEGSTGWIAAQSDFMGSRWNHRMEDLVTASNDIGLNRGKLSAELRDAAVSVGVDPDLVHRFADSYLYGIHKVIQMAEVPSWLAAYQQARTAGREHADSVASADNAVLDAFGGGDTLDLAGIQRSTQGKLFTSFMSFSLTMHRQNYEMLSKDASVGRKVTDAALLNLVPVVFLGALFHQVHKKDTLAHELAAEVFAHITGMFVGVRELSGAMLYRDYQGPAALSPIGTATRLIYDTAQTLRADTSEKMAKKATVVAKSAAELGSQYYGVPVYQVEKTAAGIQALWDKKTSDLSVLLFGPPPKGAN